MSRSDMGDVFSAQRASPFIQTLPVELIGRILSSMIPHPTTEELRQYKPQNVLKLTEICRYLRQVAHSTSKLWTILEINLKTSPDLVHLWLSRAKTRPLSLTVSAEKEDKSRIEALMRTVIPLFPRCERLDLRLPGLAFNFLPRSPVILPFLTSLHLGVQVVTVPVVIQPISLIDKAPRLTTLSINSFWIHDITIRGDTITSLCLMEVYAYECLVLASSTSRLKHLALARIIPDESSISKPPPHTPTRITLPLLASFHWVASRYDTFVNTTTLLERIIAPSLVSCRLCAGSLWRPPFFDFIRRCAASLSVVVLAGFSEQELLDLWGDLPWASVVRCGDYDEKRVTNAGLFGVVDDLGPYGDLSSPEWDEALYVLPAVGAA